MPSSPSQTDLKKLKKNLTRTPTRDDVHEQRESDQQLPGFVRRTMPSLGDVKKLDPIRDPAASTTNEDLERAEGEGMVAPPPQKNTKKKKEKRHEH